MKRLHIIILLTLTSCTVEQVSSTERGVVLYDKQNSSSHKEILGPGTHYIPIYDDVVKVDILPKTYVDEFDCLTKDEKPIRIKTSMMCFPIPDQVDSLFEMYRDKYYEILIIPELRAAVRNSVSQYDSSALTANKEIIADWLSSNLQKTYNDRHAAMNDFKIEWLN